MHESFGPCFAAIVRPGYTHTWQAAGDKHQPTGTSVLAAPLKSLTWPRGLQETSVCLQISRVGLQHELPENINNDLEHTVISLH